MKLIKQTLATLVLILTFNVWASGQWTAIQNFPATPTDGAFSFVIGNTAYVGGGLSETSMFAYDKSSNTWNQKADVPSPGASLAWAFAFVINGKAYVGGGSYATASDLTDDVWEYDPGTDQWSQKADFPEGPKDGCFAFAVGGKGYVGGGFDGVNVNNAFYEYDPVMDQWTQKPVYAGGPVIFGAAFVVNDVAYVGTGGAGSAEISDLYMWDAMNEMWVQKAAFPGDSRQAAVAFSVNGKGYIGGGMSGYSVVRKDFWEYDPAGNSWSQVSSSIYPDNSIAWSTGFAIGNDAYVGTGTSLPDFVFSNKFYKYTFTPTGIDRDAGEQFMNVYPNPAQDHINVNVSAGEMINRAEILDISGRAVKEYIGKNNSIKFNIFDLPEGIYTLKIVSGENCESRLFVKSF